MATSAIYRLMVMGEREESSGIDEDVDEGWFQTGDRTSWDFTLQLQRMDAGVTLEVVVDSSPTGDDGTWSEVVSFGTLTDTTSDPVEQTDQTVDLGEQVIRARAKTLTGGNATFGVTATSAFFRIGSEDEKLLSQALRDLNTDDRTRIVERAEAMVMDTAIGRDHLGKLECDLTEPDALGRMRRAIARQAEHLYQRDQLAGAREASALVTLREMGEMADDARELVGALTPHDGARVWMGR